MNNLPFTYNEQVQVIDDLVSCDGTVYVTAGTICVIVDLNYIIDNDDPNRVIYDVVHDGNYYGFEAKHLRKVQS